MGSCKEGSDEQPLARLRSGAFAYSRTWASDTLPSRGLWGGLARLRNFCPVLRGLEDDLLWDITRDASPDKAILAFEAAIAGNYCRGLLQELGVAATREHSTLTASTIR
ncbi:MAG TPA: hypothetical protein VN638_09220 [Nitrospiraceae bacterium]|nr:hypothetical protein [Nitrospiraceae bacterium]